MRVTGNAFAESLVNQLGRLTTRQNRLQSQAASGQRVTLPEDDPVAMQRILDLQSQAGKLSQYRENIARLGETAQASYGVLTQLKKISDRAGELAVLADGTKSPKELELYATEVNELLKQAVQVSNTQFQGNYLLSGTLSDQPPFGSSTDAEGKVVAVNYQGNQSIPAAEIAQGTVVSVLNPGSNSTGAGARGLITDSRFGADFFNHLISLRDHLLAGNTTAIADTDRSNLGKDEENLVHQVGQNAIVQARLEAVGSAATKQGDAMESLISKQADADLAQTMVQLNQTQNAYRAALQSGATLLSTSLLDYMH
jgi:flagellar hook-associated protein 3 FlgL